MNRFPEFVARLKAWQVFLLLVFPHFVGGMEQVVNAISQFTSTQPPSDKDPEPLLWFVGLLAFPLWLTWVVALGVAANRRVQPSLRGPVWIAVCSALCAVILGGYGQLTEATRESLFDGEPTSTFGFPLVWLGLFSVLYPVSFTAKNITQVRRPTTISLIDWWLVFCQLLCFPLGVWLVQPWANKLTDGTSENV